MQNIQFDGFTLKLNDFVDFKEDGETIYYVTDCEIDGNEFETFREFLWNHSRENEYFTTNFNGEPFQGRFGQFIFSKQGATYNLRLVLVKSSSDKEETQKIVSFVTHDHEYSNLIKKVVEQEIIIERLISNLKEKDILSESEITDIISVTENDRSKNQVELRSEVEDLEKYLKDKKDTISDLKKSNESSNQWE